MTTVAQDSNSHTALEAVTKVVAAFIVVFGFFVVGVMLYVGLTSDRAALQRDQALLDNAFDQSISRILNEQKSVAWWDDTINNVVVNLNKEWIDENVGVFLTETYGQDELYLVSDKDEIIYSTGEAPPDGLDGRLKQFAPIIAEIRGSTSILNQRRDVFGASQNNYNELKVLDYAKWRGHILQVGGHPAVVAAITIAPTIDMRLAKGVPYLLVSVVYIDNAFIADLSRALLIPDLSLSQPQAAKGAFTQPFVTDSGAVAGTLSWTPRRPGKILLTLILPLVMLGLSATGYITALALRRLQKASAELAGREADASYRAKHDPLSGLPNRRYFTEVTQVALESLRSTDPRIVTIAYLDIDRFKDINDTLGHEAGDELVRAVAARLGERVEKTDFLARFGGDELAVLRVSSGDQSGALSRLLLDAFREPYDFSGQHIRVSVSVGTVVAPQHGLTVEDLMRHADIALYRAKAEGRDRAIAFTEQMSHDVQLRRAVEVDLREAIARDQLDLYYQPIVSAKTSAVSGVEALLRWRHPLRGDISPATFIPIAEEAGLMPTLGAWVIERALSDHALWPELQTSINLSPDQFRHVDIADFLAKAVEKHSIDPSHIVLEITESLLLEPSPRVTGALASLRELGFKIALDDFGTGYSSLTYLRVFQFDKLKIDRSFVTEVPDAVNTRTIVRAIVGLGRSLGMEVVAEGVETEAEVAMMRMFGCTSMQGYYFSRPIDREACATLIREQRAGLGRSASEAGGAAVIDFGLR